MTDNPQVKVCSLQHSRLDFKTTKIIILSCSTACGLMRD